MRIEKWCSTAMYMIPEPQTQPLRCTGSAAIRLLRGRAAAKRRARRGKPRSGASATRTPHRSFDAETAAADPAPTSAPHARAARPGVCAPGASRRPKSASTASSLCSTCQRRPRLTGRRGGGGNGARWCRDGTHLFGAEAFQESGHVR
jgi:hypothetical protein